MFRPNRTTNTLDAPHDAPVKIALPDPPVHVSRPTSYGGYMSKYGSLSMPKGPTPRPSAARNQHPPDRCDIIERLTGPCAEGEAV